MLRSFPASEISMFETVAPEAFRPRSQRIFYETLPISIAVHLVGIGGAFVSMFWNVDLPTQSPKVIVAYSLTQVPDPPPPPPAPPKVEAPKSVTLARLAPPPPVAPSQIVAPTVIPDTIPDIAPPLPASPPPPVAAPVAAAPAVADAEGAGNGLPTGQPGGSGHALGVPGGISFGNDGRVYVDRTVKLPLKEVDHEYPHYPEAARKKKLEGTCVIRYTVGKNGHVVDVAILDHASDPMFDEETLNTVRAWVYRPMKVNGQPVEVVHEVEVNYQYIVR